MFPYLILGIALLAGFLLAGRWYSTADTKTLLKALKWLLLGVVVSVALFFVFTGKLAWAFATLPALIPWFLRARQIARMAKTFSRMSQAAGGGAPGTGNGATSDVETRFLRMTLDHTSGAMTGEVLAGAFVGRRVETLSMQEAVALLRECWTADEESAQLVEAFLERTYPDWREMADAGAGAGAHDSGGGTAAGGGGPMDRAEALKILGLEEGATFEQIKDAHRRLIAGMHPDHGGSDYLAAKINQAKDFLLGE